MDLSVIGIAETNTPQHITAIRLVIATVLGRVIGFEREADRGSAGLRTHMLIALAACLFASLAFENSVKTTLLPPLVSATPTRWFPAASR